MSGLGTKMLRPNNLEGIPAKEAVMQLESKRIESIIHHWILLEEAKQRNEQLLARAQSMVSANFTNACMQIPAHGLKRGPGI
jgi:hypothetical protein